MVAATEQEALILPPVPSFYLKPKGVSEIVDQIAARAIDLLRISDPLAKPWDGAFRRA
jgi:4-hydroxy-3-polyprenylbenzoate decarboxylase